MIIVLGGIKGGAGKSTIAVNLAVARATKHRVALVDGDEQQSTTMWWTQRQNEFPNLSPNLTYSRVSDAQTRDALQKLLLNVEDIIVDVGGRDTNTQRAALSIADLLLVPLQPRSVDLWTLGNVSAIVTSAKTINSKLKCAAFVNRAVTSGTDNQEAEDIIKDAHNIELATAKIGDRKAFSNSFGAGLAVPEVKPVSSKALEELQSLYLYCYH